MLAAVWGISGVTVFLGTAVYRISERMLVALESPLSSLEWLALAGFVLFMAYYEGYKGFQKSFSPRVAARALYLSRSATWVSGLLAPFFCLGYFGTTRKRQWISILLTLAIIVLVMIVGKMPQPWRGIVDAGVVIGLLWGTVSMLVFVGMAFTKKNFSHSPELSLHYLNLEHHKS